MVLESGHTGSKLWALIGLSLCLLAVAGRATAQHSCSPGNTGQLCAACKPGWSRIDGPDGALYVSLGDRTARVRAAEEPLGLRVTAHATRPGAGRSGAATTWTFPTLRDPSELRSEFSGRLVRSLLTFASVSVGISSSLSSLSQEHDGLAFA